jgi:hypothetical protein
LYAASFSLTSFHFHYLSGIIPLAPVPYGVFWGVGEGRAQWSTGRGGATMGGEGQQRGGQHGQGRIERGGPARAEGGARAKKDRARGSSTGALCTRFTLVLLNFQYPTLGLIFNVLFFHFLTKNEAWKRASIWASQLKSE